MIYLDNSKAVYKILTVLEKSMDMEEFNMDLISPERLGVSHERWSKYMEMISDVGYIKGVEVERDITGATVVNCDDIRITLKGLEYLQENSIMQKLYITVKGSEIYYGNRITNNFKCKVALL